VIPGIVLAAGRSSRMGRPKALLPLGRGVFLTRIVETLRAAGVDDVVIVLGHEAEAIAAALESYDVEARVVVNAEYDQGQASSLAAGLRAIDRPGVTAALVTLVDVPLVTAATVRAVLDRYLETGAPIVRPVSGSRHGHPLLIDRSLFAPMLAADPDAGVKPIVRAHVSPAGEVEVDDAGAFRDVDTPEDYARLH
jgi:molybdenum cofactor cytidylyltransferase